MERVNYDGEVREYAYGLHKLRRAAKLDQWIEKAECQVQVSELWT